MKRIVLVLSVAALVFGPVQGGDAVKDDLAKLQGTWVVVKEVTEGKPNWSQTEKITFSGNKMIFFNKGSKDEGKKPEDQITFSIDPSKKPKAMDIKFPDYLRKPSVVWATAIYLLEGDNLKIAFMSAGGKDEFILIGRPTGFDGKDKSTTLILKREVPQKPALDHDAILGTWEVTFAFLEGKPAPDYKGVHFHFTRDAMHFGKKDAGIKDKWGVNYKLNPSKKLKEIDTSVQLGSTDKPLIQLGIYELNGDDLKLRWEAVGAGRPADFDMNSKTSSFFTLKRVNKAGK